MTAINRWKKAAESNGRAERDAKIYARRIEGLTCKAIANEFGLSKARVLKSPGIWNAKPSGGNDN